jgi:opacity protein-like surface antigen
MKYLPLVAILSLFTVQPALAADYVDPVYEEDDEAIRDLTGADYGDSMLAREGKLFGATPRIGVGIFNLMPGYGLDLFYNRTFRYQVGIQYLQGEQNFQTAIEDRPLATMDEANLKARTFLILNRYYIGNSFSVYGGAGYRQVEWRVAAVSPFQDSKSSVDGKASSFFAGIGVGNGWTWDSGFTLGIDWFGIFWPMGTKLDHSESNRGPSDKEVTLLIEKAEDKAEDYAKTYHTQLGVLNIGWLF